MLVCWIKLLRIPIKEHLLKLAKQDKNIRTIKYITYANMNINGYKERIFGYVINYLAYLIILGDPWMRRNDAVYCASPRTLRIRLRKHSIIIYKSS